MQAMVDDDDDGARRWIDAGQVEQKWVTNQIREINNNCPLIALQYAST